MSPSSQAMRVHYPPYSDGLTSLGSATLPILLMPRIIELARRLLTIYAAIQLIGYFAAPKQPRSLLQIRGTIIGQQSCLGCFLVG